MRFCGHYTQAIAGDAEAKAMIIKLNTQEAVRWALEAEDANATTAFAAGVLCELGLDVTKDLQMALQLYRKAAGQSSENVTRHLDDL